MKKNKESTKDMTTGAPLRCIINFAVPLMIGGAFQQLYTMTDTAIVGRVLGVKGLAALGACDLLIWLVSAGIQAFSEGCCIKAAYFFGSKDEEKLRCTVCTSALICAIFACGLTAFLQIAAPKILLIMKVQAHIYQMALTYLRIIYVGIPFVMAYNLMFGILKAVGDSKTQLKSMCLSAVINIVLDICFVVLLNWGIQGAAIATIIAQASSACFSLYKIRGLKIIGPAINGSFLNGVIAHEILSLSVPLTIQIIIGAVGGLVVQSVVNTYEITFIAGYAATYKIYGLLEVAAISYGYAVTTYTSQNYGAGDFTRMKKGLISAELVAVATSVIIGVVMILLGESIVGIFISGTPEEIAETVPIGYRFLFIMSICLSLLYTLYVCKAFVQGTNHPFLTTVSSIFELTIRLLTVLFLTKVIGKEATFWAEPFAWTSSAIILSLGAIYYLKRLNRIE